MKRAGQHAGLGRLVEDTYFGEDPLQSFRRLLPSLTAAREADSLFCRFFRSGTWSVTPASAGGIAKPRYCCLKSLDPEGPDGAGARPDDCTDQRPCFEPAERSREPES
jgi:hypothetical protein